MRKCTHEEAEKLNRKLLSDLQDQINDAFPWALKKAFYIERPEALNVSESDEYKRLFAGATGEIRDSGLTLRTYRHSEQSDPRSDVDEIRGAEKEVVVHPSKGEIEDHHLNRDIPHDIMRRNNMAFEVVPDGNGGARLNVKPDGLVSAYVNFTDEALVELGFFSANRKTDQ